MKPGMSISARLRWPIVKKAINDHRPASIVEVGCGRGALIERLSESRVYRGYEPDRASFDTARQAVASLAHVELYNEVLPERPDRVFDALVAFEVLEHIADDATALSRWADWISDDGMIILSVPADPARFGPSDIEAGHFRRYDREQLGELITDAGFTTPTIYTWGMPLGYLLEGIRNRIAQRDPSETTIEERTAKSGRWLQLPALVSAIAGLVVWPFAVIQLPFKDSRRGTGLIAIAHRRRSPE